MSSINELIIKAFPAFLTNDVLTLLEKIKLESKLSMSDCFTVSLNREFLEIPNRIYFKEPFEWFLNETELLILNALFTRHHDGFIREKRLKRMLSSNEYWITPFVMKLLGEYVVEILFVIKTNLDESLIKNLARFSEENPDFFEIIKCRITSYWNCYYRTQFPVKETFAGFEIINAIEKIKLQTQNSNKKKA